MKAAIIMVCMTLAFFAAFGQNALILLKFEDAEKAFNSGNYEEALHHLDEVEQQAGVTSKTLYLRVVAENELLDSTRLYEDDAQFDRLQRIRESAKKYLNALSGQPIDDKYRSVYRISENLSFLPENRQQWVKGRAVHQKRLEEEKQKQQEAQKLAEQKQKDLEYNRLYNGLLSLSQARLNPVARLSTGPEAGTATVYIMRPKKGTKNMMQFLLINEGAIKTKLKPGDYVQYRFIPGLVKIGETTAQNKRKVSTGAALLMGGVVGLAATSGKTIAKSAHPFFLRLEADKSYYVTAVVTKEKTILYRSIEEAAARSLLAGLDEVKP